MHGSFPTTHALCPGGTTAVSPGPVSVSVPSSITTFILPDITYIVCGAWQLFVFTNGLTHFSQLHPGSNVDLPITTSPRFASSIFPFSNVRVSSGEESKLFFCMLANCFVKSIIIVLIRSSLFYLVIFTYGCYG